MRAIKVVMASVLESLHLPAMGIHERTAVMIRNGNQMISYTGVVSVLSIITVVVPLPVPLVLLVPGSTGGTTTTIT